MVAVSAPYYTRDSEAIDETQSCFNDAPAADDDNDDDEDDPSFTSDDALFLGAGETLEEAAFCCSDNQYIRVSANDVGGDEDALDSVSEWLNFSTREWTLGRPATLVFCPPSSAAPSRQVPVSL
nr:hypothetical protein BaRGS_034553 [Batillaria attramentaria]